jgi:hypothetical protein
MKVEKQFVFPTLEDELGRVVKWITRGLVRDGIM